MPFRLLLCVPIAAAATPLAGHLAAQPPPAALAGVFPLPWPGPGPSPSPPCALIGTLGLYWESSLALMRLWFGLFFVLSGYTIPLAALPGLAAPAPSSGCPSASSSRCPSRSLSASRRPRGAAAARRAVALRGAAPRRGAGCSGSAGCGATPPTEADALPRCAPRPVATCACSACSSAPRCCSMMQYRVDFFVERALGLLDRGLAGAALGALQRTRRRWPAGPGPRRCWSSAWFTVLKGVLEGAIQPALQAVVEHIRTRHPRLPAAQAGRRAVPGLDRALRAGQDRRRALGPAHRSSTRCTGSVTAPASARC